MPQQPGHRSMGPQVVVVHMGPQVVVVHMYYVLLALCCRW